MLATEYQLYYLITAPLNILLISEIGKSIPLEELSILLVNHNRFCFQIALLRMDRFEK
jgi:hypothetical protein